MPILFSAISIKYIGIIICGIYFCLKILNYKAFSLVKIGLFILYSLFFGILVCSSTYFSPFADIIVMAAMLVYVAFITKSKVKVVLPVAIISYVISYSFYLISIALAGILLYTARRSPQPDRILSLIALIFQILLSHIPFMFRRLKNGLPFFQNQNHSGIGLLISGMIVFFIALIRYDLPNKHNYIFLTLATVVCILGIIFWWRDFLTKLYLEKNTKRLIDELNRQLCAKDLSISNLEKENQRLANLIHRDNKIVPAIGMAVRKYAAQFDQNCPDNARREGDSLIGQLDILMKDRYDAVIQAKNLSKVLPDTHVEFINGILQYMYLRASQHNIDYDVLVFCDVKYMTQTLITELELSTILSDLIENAIIATSPRDYKKIVISIFACDQSYEIDIQDSGSPFEKAIFEKMGIQKATSHLQSGGSGIGLMTLFEILRKHNASLIIEEFRPSPDSLTKSIKIRFDNKSQFELLTYRADDLRAEICRKDIMILPLEDKV